jgi:hypothetical protein
MEIEGWAFVGIGYLLIGLAVALVDMGFTLSTAGDMAGDILTINFAKSLFLWPVRLLGG